MSEYDRYGGMVGTRDSSLGIAPRYRRATAGQAVNRPFIIENPFRKEVYLFEYDANDSGVAVTDPSKVKSLIEADDRLQAELQKLTDQGFVLKL